MPNLVAYQGSPSSAECWARWYVPVEDNSHEEFTVRFFGDSPITGEPLGAAHEVLLKAIEEIRTQRRGSPESPVKDL
jgi:hypothetical protein